jgi:flagellar L-ring protein FlgH
MKVFIVMWMLFRSFIKNRRLIVYQLVMAGSFSCPVVSHAQSGSLFTRDQADVPNGTSSERIPPPGAPSPIPDPIPQLPAREIAPPIFPPGPIPNSGLQAASWTYVPPNPTRILKIHDIVSIRVDKLASSTAQGNVQSRKTGLYDARLNDWIELVGWDTVKPSPQRDGDPRVQGTGNEVYRAQSNLQTREQLTFSISAEIADVQPNGNIVLSARETVTQNDNAWEISLSGICRPQDIGPDNTVLSRNIFDLKIKKDERGHVRDGYSRGWFTRWLARFKPF